MAITPLPIPPLRSDPTNFAARGDEFLGALPQFQVEANALAAAMNLNSTTDSSTSSITIGTGAKTFVVSSGKSFQPGMYLVIADVAAPSTNSMFGQITSYSGTSLVMSIISVRGSGTKSSWVISQSSAGGAQAGPLASSGITGAAASGANTDITSLASPALGSATATTQSPGDNSTKVATTAFVAAADVVVSAIDSRSKIQSIDYSLASNALTLKVNPTVLDFRSSTLTSGTPSTISITSQISTVISSGSTGGTTSGVQSDILVLVINNAGTPEVAWCNAACGLTLDGSNLINTTAEGGAGAADSISTIYSTTARTSVAYRVVGLFRSTQTTAGTWAVTPTLVQGFGGDFLTAMNGVNQVNGATTSKLLTGGGILKWGTGNASSASSGTTTTVTFPVAFPSGAFYGSACILTVGDQYSYFNVSLNSGTSMTLTRGNVGNNSSNTTFMWFALGY